MRKTKVPKKIVEVSNTLKVGIQSCHSEVRRTKKSLISNHFGNNLDLLSSKFDNYLLMGDFNSEPNEPAISDFCEIYNTKNIIKEKTSGADLGYAESVGSTNIFFMYNIY